MRATTMNSSVIAAARHDADTNVLELDFHSGRTYRYLMGPLRVYDELISAPSAGTYFNERIRPRYAAYRVR
jgi:hypothetical protein